MPARCEMSADECLARSPAEETIPSSPPMSILDTLFYYFYCASIRANPVSGVKYFLRVRVSYSTIFLHATIIIAMVFGEYYRPYSELFGKLLKNALLNKEHSSRQ